MAEPFSRTFEIRWSDLDSNRHVANTAILGMMIETRMAFLRSRGMEYAWFEEKGIGPAILSETNWYLREILPDDVVTVQLRCAGYSPDLRFWRWLQELRTQDGKLCAIHQVNFVWLDLKARKMVAAPLEMAEVFLQVARDAHFSLLDSADFRLPESLQHIPLMITTQ